ncbi:MAG: 30S ribosomal protein S17 [Candidatus Liberibacter europaeus]|uniref:Small ribosomal subunit protein uS17 n=1 Tax=Candidatus Liberibacter europaeus TaxID=744859 RepID=A0A2T4VY33_9HYPH|nr:30S ribosomal protein S17 [Candidatus Liberibacter europaeus]PTL86689.1 MAG: 30S ribosomal protein S17 [Candidatus Liberibacter europaeus]
MAKQILRGIVVSSSANKTIAVKVERRFPHRVLKKTISRSKKYAAHDENNEFKVGEVAYIEERAPFSKTKNWLAIRSLDK